MAPVVPGWQEEEWPRMFRSICIPVPAQHTAAIPSEWWISVETCKIMAKVPEWWWWKQLSQTWAPHDPVDFLSQPHCWGNVPGVRWHKLSWCWWHKNRCLVKRVGGLKHGAACPALQSSVSTAGQWDNLQWWWPCHRQSHRALQELAILPPRCMKCTEGLDKGSVCGFYLHLFTMLMTFSHIAWLDRSSLCTWLLHWSAGRFCLWSQWHHLVGSCACVLLIRERSRRILCCLYGWDKQQRFLSANGIHAAGFFSKHFWF